MQLITLKATCRSTHKCAYIHAHIHTWRQGYDPLGRRWRQPPPPRQLLPGSQLPRMQVAGTAPPAYTRACVCMPVCTASPATGAISFARLCGRRLLVQHRLHVCTHVCVHASVRCYAYTRDPGCFACCFAPACGLPNTHAALEPCKPMHTLLICCSRVRFELDDL